MRDYYKLDEEKNAVPCSVEEWSKQYEEMRVSDTKHVKKEIINDYFISTVFLGLNHGYDDSVPLIFETMINHKTKGWLNYTRRYPTWKLAEEGHQEAVEWVKNGCKEDEE